MNYLLKKMEGVANRNARFKTVISLVKNGHNNFFEGVIEGILLNEPKGNQGFGYDPIFQPHGYHVTFAEMEMGEKNKISHRAIAMKKLIDYLKTSV